MLSVTTVRITEHNRGSAAVMPVQGKQQEAVVVHSAVMKLALRQTVTLPLWPPQHICPCYTYTRKEVTFFNWGWVCPLEDSLSFSHHLPAHLLTFMSNLLLYIKTWQIWHPNCTHVSDLIMPILNISFSSFFHLATIAAMSSQTWGMLAQL